MLIGFFVEIFFVFQPLHFENSLHILDSSPLSDVEFEHLLVDSFPLHALRTDLLRAKNFTFYQFAIFSLDGMLLCQV